MTALATTQITSVAVTGVVAPVVGETLSSVAAVAADAGYTITGTPSWDYKAAGSTEWESATGTFAEGNRYRISVQLAPKEGYAFAYTINARLNGHDASYFGVYDGSVYVTYDFGILGDLSTISTLNITVDGYKLGEKILNAVPAIDTSGLNPVQYEWCVMTDDNQFLPATGKFERDRQYVLSCFYNVVSGFVIDGIAAENIKVNGKTASYFNHPWNSSGLQCDVRVFHYFPRLEGAYQYGDINADGAVNTTDALLNLKCSVKKITFSGQQFAEGDVNADKQITVVDALLVLQFAVHKRSLFPCEILTET